jgi:methionyl-tRNA synthetase
MNKKFITCTLPYLNGVPHIGHCFEFILADFISDYFRNKLGKDNVFFNLGVDEHGQKIAQKAKEEGFENIQEFCDKYADVWKQFCSDFQIDYNNFYRTTSSKHKE